MTAMLCLYKEKKMVCLIIFPQAPNTIMFRSATEEVGPSEDGA